MKELVKNIISVIAFILLIIIVYFGDAFNGTSLEKIKDILYIILAISSFCLVVFLISYGIYLYLKKYSKKGF